MSPSFLPVNLEHLDLGINLHISCYVEVDLNSTGTSTDVH